MHPLGIIDDLRRIVFAEYATTYLKNRAFSDLKIYLHKASFDTNDEPLEEDCSISRTIGQSKQEALIVVVPTLLDSLEMQDEIKNRFEITLSYDKLLQIRKGDSETYRSLLDKDMTRNTCLDIVSS